MNHELDKIAVPADAVGGPHHGPYRWSDVGDGRYARTYLVSERFIDDRRPDVWPLATVSVMGQQFNDGTIERRAYLEGPVMEDRAMDARQAREMAVALIAAADEIGSFVVTGDSIVNALTDTIISRRLACRRGRFRPGRGGD